MDHQPTAYKTYWVTWFILLILTVVMIAFDTPVILIPGICLKAAIIGLVYMHLAKERLDFTLVITCSTLLLALILFFLIAPDGRALL